ncbi:MAG TPA: hypothetical protein VEK15_29880, partial [Vicinamibacteria bacterium]|nr:hypothetical protein [Vicinamibacteria bacterium]
MDTKYDGRSRTMVAACLGWFACSTPPPESRSAATEVVLEGIAISEAARFVVSPSECTTLDATPDGRFVHIACPVDAPRGKSDAFVSSVAVVRHDTGSDTPFVESMATDLGGGEITDVAVASDGSFFVVNIREDDVNHVNCLLVMRDGQVGQKIDLKARADGIGLSPDDRLLVVAVEKGAAIEIYDTSEAASNVVLAAVVDREAMLPYFDGEEARLERDDIEPESVAFSADGRLALVSLQEQSSIALVNLERLIEARASGGGSPRAPEEVGALSLEGVVHLPFGFKNERGRLVGVEPDGLSVSPDGTFAVTANEASTHTLQGISVIDLRRGATQVPEPLTFCIFDIDPSLLDGTGVGAADACQAQKGSPPPAYHDNIPRVDPNNTVILDRGGRTIAAINIERSANERRQSGSVLFVDMDGVLDGRAKPAFLARKEVSPNAG